MLQLGYFAMPSHPPERGLKAGHDWDLQVLRWLDGMGYAEAWIGEHHTAPWEPHPAPDLLVAQALKETQRIRLGPGGFLLPYHHPAELANRVAMLDHLSEGRLNFGVAASGLPSDWAMFHVDGMSGVNREMTREALDIILRLWTEEAPFTHEGKFWKVSAPETMFGFLKPHIRPLQKPHPPIGVAGLSKNSDTLKLAGERGFLPMSLNLNPAYVSSHWDSVEAGARRAGRTPDRRDWRLVREVFVAETDAEAWRLSVGSMMALTSVVSASLMEDRGEGFAVAVVIGVLVLGLVLGAINGTLIVVTRVPDIVVTLAMLFVWAGCALLVMETPGGASAQWLRGLTLGPLVNEWIPKAAVVMLLVVAIVWIPIRRSRLGLSMYAIGSDPLAAFRSGVSVGRTKILAYALTGLFSAFGGLSLTATTGIATPVPGPYTLMSVAAVVLGGVSLSGGRGGVFGPIVAVVILSLLRTIMTFLNVNTNLATVVQGGILVGVVMVGSLIQLRRKRG